MKVVYCIKDYSQTGGMDRIICFKANYLAENSGHEVIIITTDQGTRKSYFELSPKITHYDLNIFYNELYGYSFLKKIILQIKKRIQHKKRLKKLLYKLNADIVISTYTDEFTILPTLHDRSKKIGEIHFSKESLAIGNKNKRKSFILKKFSMLAGKRKRSFVKKYDKFVVLTKEDLKNWKNLSNVTQIYNPLPFHTQKSADPTIKRVISVGRLTHQKGYDLLIRAWSIIKNEVNGWQLDIFGGGEELENLQNLIKEKKVEDSVKINPSEKDIIKEYLNSSIYVMSSRYEGFPMVLLEAISCGLPCISFACPHGPSEVIEEEENGFLVENGNIQLLAEKIRILIHDEELRIKMSRKAKDKATEFLPDTIMKEWNNLFREVIKENTSCK